MICFPVKLIITLKKFNSSIQSEVFVLFSLLFMLTDKTVKMLENKCSIGVGIYQKINCFVYCKNCFDNKLINKCYIRLIGEKKGHKNKKILKNCLCGGLRESLDSILMSKVTPLFVYIYNRNSV